MTKNQHNFLPAQYDKTNSLPINHNYLKKQFNNNDKIFDDIKKLVEKGDYTLGEQVNELEEKFTKICGTKYALGVGSGTDAIFLSLIASGLQKGDEVITTPYTFYATLGAIITAGGTPVFVDIGQDYNIDPDLIEKAITKRTKAIVPSLVWSDL